MNAPIRRIALVLLCLVSAAPRTLAQAGPLRKNLAAAVEVHPGLEQVRETLLGAVAPYPDAIIADIFDVAGDPQALMAGGSSGEFKAAYDRLARYPEVIDMLRAHPLSTRAIGRMAHNDQEGCWNTIREIRQKSGDAPSETVSGQAEGAGTAYPTSVPPPVPGSSSWVGPSAATAIILAPSTAAVSISTPPLPGAIVTTSDVKGTAIVRGSAASGATVGTVYSGEHAAHAGGAVVATDGEGHVKTGTAGGTTFTTQGGVNGAAGHAGTSTIDLQSGTSSSAEGAAVVLNNGQAAGAARAGSSQWDANSYTHSGQGTVQSTSGKGGTWSRTSSGQASGTSASRSADTQAETNKGETVSAQHSAEVTKTGSGYDVDRSTEVSSSSGKAYSHDNSQAPALSQNPAPGHHPSAAATHSAAAQRSFDANVHSATLHGQAEFSKAESKLSAGGGKKPSGSSKPGGRSGRR